MKVTPADLPGVLTIEPRVFTDARGHFFESFNEREFYHPQSERGVRWNDPKFGIEWPVEPHIISAKDASHRDFDPAWHFASREVRNA